MDKDRLTTLLRQGSSEIGVSLDSLQLEQFWLYLQELLEWNNKVNLTAIRDPDGIIIKHFVDSLSPLPYLDRSASLLDIGPGAGFPGIPMKIAAPQIQLQLVEANRKRVSFLKHLVRTLQLEGVTAIHSRIEDLPQTEPSCRTLISRAFRRLDVLLQVVSPILGQGHTLVAMLGPTTKEEQHRFEDLALMQNLELGQVVSLELPHGLGGRTLLFFNSKSGPDIS